MTIGLKWHRRDLPQTFSVLRVPAQTMRPILLVAALFFAAPSISQAQALHLEGRTFERNATACSQSSQSNVNEASFSLVVTAQHTATLEIVRTHLGRSGHRGEPTFIGQTRDVARFTGTAIIHGDSLDLELTRTTRSHVAWEGEGPAPAATPSRSGGRVSIHCERSAEPVFAAVREITSLAPEKDAPSRMRNVYRCVASPDSEFGSEPFPLARTPVVQITRRYGEPAYLRFVFRP